MTRVAVVGTGRMGSAMARALARAGWSLVVHNRTAERAEALASEIGAQVAATPAAAAAAAEITLTMLADEDAVRSIWAGPDGLLDGARSGSVLADMSTVPPSIMAAFAERARAADIGILDAPVSGSVALAEAGQLTIMAGGAGEDLERARPAFEALAKRVFHMGPLGSGAAMKLAVNGVIFALNNALSEALVLAERAGIERSAAYDVLAESAVGAPFVDYKRQAFLDPESAPVAFSLDLAAKDLRLISAFADSVGLDAPQVRANADLVRAASDSVGPDRDFSEVATYLRSSDGEGRAH